ncbi:hypothetical protein CNR22_02840 [Sphingobacteriaceae bacterium]|nr:hypothetical protein CNR22_02840 [Sphingobacteriaceae bacterium]
MKNKLILIGILFLMKLSYGQNYSIKIATVKDSEVLSESMNMAGVNYFMFDLPSPESKYINIYVDECLNDSMIKKYDFVSSQKKR